VRGFRPSPHSLQIPFIFQTKQCTTISEPWLAPAGSRVIIADVQSRQKTKSFFLDKRCLFYYITNSSYFFLHVPFVERSLPLLSQRKSAGKRLHSAFPSLRVFIAPAFFSHKSGQQPLNQQGPTADFSKSWQNETGSAVIYVSSTSSGSIICPS